MGEIPAEWLVLCSVIFGSWFDHVSGWLNADDKDRIMYISYEEMIMVRYIFFLSKLVTQTVTKLMWVCLCGAGLEGLCEKNLSVFGEAFGWRGDQQNSWPMSVQEHETEQHVQLLSCPSWNYGSNKVSVPQERYGQLTTYSVKFARSKKQEKGNKDSVIKMKTFSWIFLYLISDFWLCVSSGIAGDWKNQLTAAEADYFDAVYKDKMKDVKYKFVWD